MKKFLLQLLFCVSLFGEYSIVFVHIGNTLPAHCKEAIAQARLFNKDARIILLANKKALQANNRHFDKSIELVSFRNVPVSDLHKQFRRRYPLKDAFWKYTSERFLFLYDLVDHFGLENVFHLENDNMLYANLKTLLPVFHDYYPNIGATFDNDKRCIPGFVWIANQAAMKHLAEHFTAIAYKSLYDMYIIGHYKNTYGETHATSLPVVMEEYSKEHQLVSPFNHTTTHPSTYSKHCNDFGAIFDGAAIGQYLGGTDPKYSPSKLNFINESCVFNPSLLTYTWEKDEEGRNVPFASYNGKKYKIINLHIHSKRLHDFRSDR